MIRVMIAIGMVARAMAGEDHVADRIPPDLPLCGDEAVEDDEVGEELVQLGPTRAFGQVPPPHLVVRDRHEAGREAPGWRERQRCVLQDDGEQVGQHQPEPEDGHRDADVRERDRGTIDRRVVLPGSDDPQGNADDHSQEERRHREFGGRRETFDQQLGDGSREPDRFTEVEGHDVLHVDAELDEHRIIEPVGFVETLTRFRRRAFTEDCRARVAGYRPDEQEHDDHDPDQHRDGVQGSSCDEAQHW